MSAIDLRSDTVTKPSPAMRRAMAEADVGDDVYGEDPTVNRLQQVAADLLGADAALFVPSGTMANQIAVQLHTRHGDDIIAGVGAHNYLFESGATGALAGAQVTIVGSDGRFSGADVEAAYKLDDHHHAPTRLVTVENTHNMGGGLLWELDAIRDVLAVSRRLGLRTHLDGARLWNASAATGVSERELVAGFDTVSVCLSKGLGAPVGSLIAGSADLIHEAHRFRKRFGGGMRQAGILAAAGLFALEHNRARLVDDHFHATALAETLGRIDGITVDLASVQTNIVMADVAPSIGTADELMNRAGERGALFYSVGPQRIRLVTHYDIDRKACERAAAIIAEVC